MLEQPAEFLCPILPYFVSTFSRWGGGWAGVGSPYLCTYSLVQRMARTRASWISGRPAAGGRSLRRRYQEQMPEMGVGEWVRTWQSELFGDSEASGSGGGDRSVHFDFSLGASKVVLAFGENLSSGIMDAGRSGSDRHVRRQQVMRHSRQESQLQLYQLQQQRPLPFDSPCSAHHQANKHHNYHKPMPRSDSSSNQKRAVGPPPQQ